MKYLFQLGYNSGATKAYLQVMTSNNVAVNFYKKLGFKECYQYWYRILNLEDV